jgi:hypothetical protein
MFVIELLRAVLMTDGELDFERLDDDGDCEKAKSSASLPLLFGFPVDSEN